MSACAFRRPLVKVSFEKDSAALTEEGERGLARAARLWEERGGLLDLRAYASDGELRPELLAEDRATALKERLLYGKDEGAALRVRTLSAVGGEARAELEVLSD